MLILTAACIKSYLSIHIDMPNKLHATYFENYNIMLKRE